MFVSHISLKNWRNFKSVDVDLGRRVFVVVLCGVVLLVFFRGVLRALAVED